MNSKVITRYEVHDISLDGIEIGNSYSPEKYSKFYENDLRYTFGDALEHIKELQSRLPDNHFGIVEVITTSRVVYKG